MLKQLARSFQSFDCRFGQGAEAMDPDRRAIFLAVMLGLPIGAMLGNGGEGAVASVRSENAFETVEVPVAGAVDVRHPDAVG